MRFKKQIWDVVDVFQYSLKKYMRIWDFWVVFEVHPQKILEFKSKFQKHPYKDLLSLCGI